jgi:hypothetical protein
VSLGVLETETAEPTRARNHRSVCVALVRALLLGIALGALGWTLPSYGSSIAIPTLIVFGIGALFIVGTVIARWRFPKKGHLRLFFIGAAVVTVLASVWTFEFSLPASFALDSSSTAQAQLALRGFNATRSCVAITHGSVGSLQAPYMRCVQPDPGFVTYSPLRGDIPAVAQVRSYVEQVGPQTTGSFGVAYTEVGASTFRDRRNQRRLSIRI